MQKQKINIKYLDNLLENTTLGFKFAYTKGVNHPNVYMLYGGKILEYRNCAMCCNYIILKNKYFQFYPRKNRYGTCCKSCAQRSRINSAAYRARKRKIGQIMADIT